MGRAPVILEHTGDGRDPQVGSAWESAPSLLLIQGLDKGGFDLFFMIFDIGIFFSTGKSGWKSCVVI